MRIARYVHTYMYPWKHRDSTKQITNYRNDEATRATRANIPAIQPVHLHFLNAK